MRTPLYPLNLHCLSIDRLIDQSVCLLISLPFFLVLTSCAPRIRSWCPRSGATTAACAGVFNKTSACQWSLGFEAIYRWDSVGKTITSHPSGNDWSSDYGWNGQIPSGKHTKNYGTSPFLMGKSTIIFYSHVSLPEANPRNGDKIGHLAVQPPSSPRTSTFWWWRACITIR